MTVVFFLSCMMRVATLILRFSFVGETMATFLFYCTVNNMLTSCISLVIKLQYPLLCSMESGAVADCYEFSRREQNFVIFVTLNNRPI